MTLANPLASLGSGAVGALTLTALHESARHVLPHAPRVDTLGRRGVARTWRLLGGRPPRGRRLHRAALVGDLVSNALYYALVGVGRARHPWRRGAVLGGLAGVGAVVLPPWLGLGWAPTRRTRATRGMTTLWYLAGGLAAAAAYRRLTRS